MKLDLADCKTKYGAFAQKHRHSALLLQAVAAVLLGILCTMLMHNSNSYLSGNWDEYSEMLVYGRMLQMQQNQSAPGGFMGVYTAEWGDTQTRTLYRDNTPVTPQEYQSYTHQTGLQGWVWGCVNKLLSVWMDAGLARENALHFICSALYYAAMAILAAALWRQLGPPAGIGWFVAGLLAPGVQAGMKNMYWNLWLWWLPLLAGLALCYAVRGGKPKVPAWCYGGVFAACLLRSLCGFEFISCFLILSEMPLVWAFVAQKENRRLWLCRMVASGFAAVGGVAAAVGVWAVQGRIYYGSWVQSFANLGGAVTSRISVTDGTVRQDATVFGVIGKYLFADKTVLLAAGPLQLNIRGVLGITLAVLCISAAVWWGQGRKNTLRKMAPAVAAWGLCFVAPLSWMALSKAHADIHEWLIPMLWHFGFVPASLALLGGLAAAWWGVLRPAHKGEK